MNRESTPLETLATPPPLGEVHKPPTVRLAIGGVIALAVIAAVVWIVVTLTPERVTKIFDLAVAAVAVGLLSVAARYLLKAEAIRRSRLVAAELIGVTFGGAALTTFFVTAASEPVGAAQLPQLLVIQLVVAVVGGLATFLLAFFVTLGVKASGKLFRQQHAEAEAIFIGVVTGAVGGGLTAHAADLGAWIPFVSAAVCAATTYRAVVLHRRYDRE